MCRRALTLRIEIACARPLPVLSRVWCAVRSNGDLHAAAREVLRVVLRQVSWSGWDGASFAAQGVVPGVAAAPGVARPARPRVTALAASASQTPNRPPVPSAASLTEIKYRLRSVKVRPGSSYTCR